MKPYKSRASLGKAVKKVTSALPKSPRKRRSVLQQIEAKENLITSSASRDVRAHPHAIPASVISKVEAFYTGDSVTYQAPGLKDFVIDRRGGTKTKIQKKHLLYTLRETYEIFKSFNENERIGFKKYDMEEEVRYSKW